MRLAGSTIDSAGRRETTSACEVVSPAASSMLRKRSSMRVAKMQRQLFTHWPCSSTIWRRYWQGRRWRARRIFPFCPQNGALLAHLRRTFDWPARNLISLGMEAWSERVEKAVRPLENRGIPPIPKPPGIADSKESDPFFNTLSRQNQWERCRRLAILKYCLGLDTSAAGRQEARSPSRQ